MNNHDPMRLFIDFCGHCLGKGLCLCFGCDGSTPSGPKWCAICGGSGTRDDEIQRSGGYVRYWIGKLRPKWPIGDWGTALRIVQELNRKTASTDHEEKFRIWREEIRLVENQAGLWNGSSDYGHDMHTRPY